MRFGVTWNCQNLQCLPQHLKLIAALQAVQGFGYTGVLGAVDQGLGFVHQRFDTAHVVLVMVCHYNVPELKAQALQGL